MDVNEYIETSGFVVAALASVGAPVYRHVMHIIKTNKDAAAAEIKVIKAESEQQYKLCDEERKHVMHQLQLTQNQVLALEARLTQSGLSWTRSDDGRFVAVSPEFLARVAIHRDLKRHQILGKTPLETGLFSAECLNELRLLDEETLDKGISCRPYLELLPGHWYCVIKQRLHAGDLINFHGIACPIEPPKAVGGEG